MTTLQVEYWQLLTLLAVMLSSFVAAIWALSKLLLRQFKDDLKQRFAAQEQLRQEARRAHERRFSGLEEANVEREREMLKLRAELPLHYVRREDAIRNETVINAKLDALATKIDLVGERFARGTE